MSENTKLLVKIYVLALEKPMFFITDDETLKQDDLAIVETTRGIELGRVMESPKQRQIDNPETYPTYVKKGTSLDLTTYNLNKEKAKQNIKEIQKYADNLKLDMKVITCEYMLDASKIIIYYTAENRVDFRELLKNLATLLRCRIELRQVGTRDKAKMIGGIGICGLKLCCSTFLNEFDGISITMAKNQMLALNIPKLSGHCGKLICCLKYENEAYTDLQKSLPRIGSKVKYNDAIYKITSMNVITKTIRLENKENILSVAYDEIKDCIMPRDENSNSQYVNQQYNHGQNKKPYNNKFNNSKSSHGDNKDEKN